MTYERWRGGEVVVRRGSRSRPMDHENEAPMDGYFTPVPIYGQESIAVVPQGATYRNTAAPYWDWTISIPPLHSTGMKIKVTAGSLGIDDFDITANETVKGLCHAGYIKRGDWILLVDGEPFESAREAKKRIHTQRESSDPLHLSIMRLVNSHNASNSASASSSISSGGGSSSSASSSSASTRTSSASTSTSSATDGSASQSPPPGGGASLSEQAIRQQLQHSTQIQQMQSQLQQLQQESANMTDRLLAENATLREQLSSFKEPVYDSGGEEVGQALPSAKRRRRGGGGGRGSGGGDGERGKERASSSSSPPSGGRTRSSTSALAALASATAGTVKVKQEAHEAVARARAAEAATCAANDRLLCVVCQDGERSVVLVPCWHCALCADCAPACATCPICRSDVTDRKAVVLS